MKFKFLVVVFLLSSVLLNAQKIDTVGLTLRDAEELFIKNNLVLLAHKYNIEGSKAAILQAKLFPNPNISFEQTLHGQKAVANDLDIPGYGQRALQIQQLFLLAGKRNKSIRIQQINSEITELQFNELARELLYQLRSNFYQIYYYRKSLAMYAEEIPTMQRLVNAYQEQYQKGNVPYKEVVRLSSFLLTLESEQSNYLKQIIDVETNLKMLLGQSSPNFIAPILDENALDLLTVNDINIEELKTKALETRYDNKIQEASIRLEEANLAFQKALAKPDITVGYAYDRAGSYVNNYNAITLSMPLPILNKNQGNIKIAENRIKANETGYKQSQIQVENDILNAYNKAVQMERIYRAFDKKVINNYQSFIDGVIDAYQKRNITLIEFTDFIESYKNTITQTNALYNDRMQAYELLNFAVGQKVL